MDAWKPDPSYVVLPSADNMGEAVARCHASPGRASPDHASLAKARPYLARRATARRTSAASTGTARRVVVPLTFA